eukprot:TRINITY_DN58724_c0_g1_i1.p1 TRINITY_DN58724_c0_g1~~TRINITY_DN58724_c0_g1_i1.p1  ORF type:complete len:235 (+),score=41.39 TRINITY_DN58724_c0_g1_i1:67-771(+)
MGQLCAGPAELPAEDSRLALQLQAEEDEDLARRLQAAELGNLHSSSSASNFGASSRPSPRPEFQGSSSRIGMISRPPEITGRHDQLNGQAILDLASRTDSVHRRRDESPVRLLPRPRMVGFEDIFSELLRPEALLELEALRHIPRGVDQRQVDARTALMTFCVDSKAALETGDLAGHALANAGCAEQKCTVCLDNFTHGDELRMLPCTHRYHRKCIDKWLARSPACPVCKHNIV